ncbi:MAG TPA: hypothetical protein VG738_01130 [Chitinophagaceae bacterium]|nr:hypothetical protein [Chitinophagaceae bacterium]
MAALKMAVIKHAEGLRRSGSYSVITMLIIWLPVLLFACSNNNATGKHKDSTSAVAGRAKFIKKPAATYQDTVIVDSPAAVFYYADTAQLEKIKAQVDTTVYKGIMHDYFFQMRYDHITIKKLWPKLKIMDCKNCRYLLFTRKKGEKECIDLNTKNDAFGLFVFDGIKSPEEVDMTNMETEFSFYLKK